MRARLLMLAVLAVTTALGTFAQPAGATSQDSGKLIDRAFTDSSVARMAKSLLADRSLRLSVNEKALLKLDVAMANKQTRDLLAALDSDRRLTTGERTRLISLMKMIAKNKAIRSVVRRGRALKRDSKRLTALARRLKRSSSSAKLPTEATGDADFDQFKSLYSTAISRTLKSTTHRRFEKLLTGSGGANQLSKLPPLTLGLLASTTPKSSTAVSAQEVVQAAKDKVDMLTEIAGAISAELTWKAAVEAAAHPWIQRAVGLSLRAVGMTLAGVLSPALATLVPAAIIIYGLYDIAQLAIRIADFATPTRLRLTPGNVDAIAGSSVHFKVDVLNKYDWSLGDATGKVNLTMSNGDCRNSESRCTSTKSGSQTVTATSNLIHGAASVWVKEGPVKRIRMSPAESSILIGQSESYTVLPEDEFGNWVPLGRPDVNLTLDGAQCGLTGWTCTAHTAGDRTVTASVDGVQQSSVLHVTAIHHLGLTPNPDSPVAPGEFVSYAVEAYDSANLPLGPITSGVVFSIDSGGCFNAPGEYACESSALGDHVVTATYEGASGSATLSVRALDHLVLSPANGSIPSGGTQTYTVVGVDASGTNLGPVSGATLSIAPEGSCSGYSCTASATGPHTVDAVLNGATGSASLSVATNPSNALTASGTVTSTWHRETSDTNPGNWVYNGTYDEVVSYSLDDAPVEIVGANGSYSVATNSGRVSFEYDLLHVWDEVATDGTCNVQSSASGTTVAFDYLSMPLVIGPQQIGGGGLYVNVAGLASGGACDIPEDPYSYESPGWVGGRYCDLEPSVALPGHLKGEATCSNLNSHEVMVDSLTVEYDIVVTST